MDGTQHQAQAFAQLLRDAWTMAVPEKQPRNVASETFMASQWASANGLHTIPLGQNSALAILCPPGPLPIQAHMAIAIQYGTPDQAIKTARITYKPSVMPWPTQAAPIGSLDYPLPMPCALFLLQQCMILAPSGMVNPGGGTFSQPKF